jgi:hypothetical protein
MKRVIASILTILYLSTSMGATVHLHYCMGRLVGWGLIDHDGKDCSFCGMQKKEVPPGCSLGKKNCCHDEHKLIQNNRDQKPSQGLNLAKAMALVLAAPPAAILDHVFLTTTPRTLSFDNGPPLDQRVPVFLRNCSFRI